jgi:hypothetical protein
VKREKLKPKIGKPLIFNGAFCLGVLFWQQNKPQAFPNCGL